MNIWLRYLIFKKDAPENRKKHILGDFLKLTNLLTDPSPFVEIPYIQTKSSKIGSFTRITLTYLEFPNIGALRLDLFFKEFNGLITNSEAKNKELTTLLIKEFITNLWKSNFFESNSDQNLVIESLEEFFCNNELEEKLSTFKTRSQIIDYFSSQIQSLSEINTLISKQVHNLSKNPRKLRRSFQDVHNEIKHIFEIYALLIGLIRGLSDIISDTSESNIEDYMNKKYGVCYGVKKFGYRQYKNQFNALPLNNRLKKYAVIRDLLENILHDKLRPIRNAESHTAITTSQNKLDNQIFIVENKKEKYNQEFTLGDFWVLKSNLFIFLTLCFNYFFYNCPDNQIGTMIKDYLEFKSFDVGFEFPDINKIWKEKEKNG